MKICNVNHTINYNIHSCSTTLFLGRLGWLLSTEAELLRGHQLLLLVCFQPISSQTKLQIHSSKLNEFQLTHFLICSCSYKNSASFTHLTHDGASLHKLHIQAPMDWNWYCWDPKRIIDVRVNLKWHELTIRWPERGLGQPFRFICSHWFVFRSNVQKSYANKIERHDY